MSSVIGQTFTAGSLSSLASQSFLSPTKPVFEGTRQHLTPVGIHRTPFCHSQSASGSSWQTPCINSPPSPKGKEVVSSIAYRMFPSFCMLYYILSILFSSIVFNVGLFQVYAKVRNGLTCKLSQMLYII